MSILSIFYNNSPSLAGVQIDAVLQDTYEGSVNITGYTIETGARAADHRVVQPQQWRIVGAVGARTLSIFDLVNDDSRPAEALTALREVMTTGEPFDIDAGDVQLSNMVITNLSRDRDASNESGLIFIAELKEFPTLDTLLSRRDNTIKQSQVNADDPISSQGAALIDKGTKAVQDASDSVSDFIGGLFG